MAEELLAAHEDLHLKALSLHNNPLVLKIRLGRSVTGKTTGASSQKFLFPFPCVLLVLSVTNPSAAKQ